LTSLSKRSNVPGLRSAASSPGTPSWITPLPPLPHLPRQRHEPGLVQAASAAAWNDEEHVVANRAAYRAKFARVTPMLAEVLDVALPDAGFYLWARVDGSDQDFARDLYAQYNVTVLPGSFLAREAQGSNPGAGRIRMALVAETEECVEAAERIIAFVRSR
jgi:N-succinyldiaminopimelate aminotransferase